MAEAAKQKGMEGWIPASRNTVPLLSPIDDMFFRNVSVVGESDCDVDRPRFYMARYTIRSIARYAGMANP